MPNTQNFKADTTSLEQIYPRYIVSRVIANKQDDLLEMEVPADFNEKFLENNIEINLYSLADNSLIFADFIKNSQAIRVETLQYTDGSLPRKLLYIDFAQVKDLILPSGQYSVTLNFFADEIGSYDSRILKVSKISTSRREVELKLTDLNKQLMLAEFALPTINSVWIIDALKQAFNQTGSSVIPANNDVLSSASISKQLPTDTASQIVEYNFEEVYDIAQQILNGAYVIAQTKVTKLLNENKTRFTTEILSSIISGSLAEEYKKYTDANSVAISQLPYDLIGGD